jgi:hypothetical protein
VPAEEGLASVPVSALPIVSGEVVMGVVTRIAEATEGQTRRAAA